MAEQVAEIYELQRENAALNQQLAQQHQERMAQMSVAARASTQASTRSAPAPDTHALAARATVLEDEIASLELKLAVARVATAKRSVPRQR